MGACQCRDGGATTLRSAADSRDCWNCVGRGPPASWAVEIARKDSGAGAGAAGPNIRPAGPDLRPSGGEGSLPEFNPSGADTNGDAERPHSDPVRRFSVKATNTSDYPIRTCVYLGRQRSTAAVSEGVRRTSPVPTADSNPTDLDCIEMVCIPNRLYSINVSAYVICGVECIQGWHRASHAQALCDPRTAITLMPIADAEESGEERPYDENRWSTFRMVVRDGDSVHVVNSCNHCGERSDLERRVCHVQTILAVPPDPAPAAGPG